MVAKSPASAVPTTAARRYSGRMGQVGIHRAGGGGGVRPRGCGLKCVYRDD